MPKPPQHPRKRACAGCDGRKRRLPMTPDHETDTLDGLIARWRKLATDSRDEAGRIRRTVFVATDAEANCFIRAEVWDGVADELAPILAGLRGLRNEWIRIRLTLQISGMDSFDAGKAWAFGRCADSIDERLGQPATADQTGAGKGEK